MVSDFRTIDTLDGIIDVSIRFEVRGGFRHLRQLPCHPVRRVSIRFEVRGGFRLTKEGG